MDEGKKDEGTLIVTRENLVATAKDVKNENIQPNMFIASRDMARARTIIFQDDSGDGSQPFKKMIKNSRGPLGRNPPKKVESAMGAGPGEIEVDIEKCREILSHRCGAGMDEDIQVLACDKPGPGGANHKYLILVVGPDGAQLAIAIGFQCGAVLEAGLNGLSCESLLAVVKDRLEGFQGGDFACESNAVALDGVDIALSALHGRTTGRAVAGADGTSKPVAEEGQRQDAASTAEDEPGAEDEPENPDDKQPAE